MAPSITTRGYNNARTGATDDETVLSATAVRTRGITKLFSMTIPDDPCLDAQPVAVGGIQMADGRVHDVIFQASMGNTVYAFDAHAGAQLWRRNLGRPITSIRDIDMHLTNVACGILSTPVIDEVAGILYACAWISPDGTWQKGQHFSRSAASRRRFIGAAAAQSRRGGLCPSRAAGAEARLSAA
jgi:hypothetical protein